MRQLIVNVAEEKVDFFMELIKNLDFVNLDSNNEVKLSSKQKGAVKDAIKSFESGEATSHNMVMEETKERYGKYFKKNK